MFGDDEPSIHSGTPQTPLDGTPRETPSSMSPSFVFPSPHMSSSMASVASTSPAGRSPLPPPVPVIQQPVVQDRFVGIKQPPTGPRAMQGNANGANGAGAKGPILVDRVANVRLAGEREKQ